MFSKTNKFELRQNSKTLRRTNKSLSIKENINKVKNNLINKFDFEGGKSEEKNDKIDEEENENLDYKKLKRVIKRQKTTNVKNLADLFSDSNGFRRLSKSIPSFMKIKKN